MHEFGGKVTQNEVEEEAIQASGRTLSPNSGVDHLAARGRVQYEKGVRQSTLTLVARVRDVEGTSGVLPSLVEERLFSHPDLGVHFARLALLRERGSSSFPPSLVLESNFDTPHADTAEAQRAHLEQLARVELDPLRAAFAGCEGFTGSEPADELADKLHERLVPATACYEGHAARDLPRIALERRVRELCLDFLSRAPKDTPVRLFHSLRSHLRLRAAWDPTLRGLDLDAPPPSAPDNAVRSMRLRSGITPWFTNLAPALPLVGYLTKILTWQREDACYDLRAEYERFTDDDRRLLRELAANEDHGLQNPLTHVVPLRAGGDARRRVLALSHAYIARMALRHFNDIGELGGIPSIHFAKWVLIDGGERLLFLSNYDGSWESYLGDFIDKADIGLNLAWACTLGYPKTVLLALGGARDEERFKAWSRSCQRPTPIFYSAYPDASVASVNNNTWIRHALHRDGPGDLAAFFRRLS